MKIHEVQNASDDKTTTGPEQLTKALVTEITPHNKAIYEAGKKLLVDSIDVGREFCEFMITTSISAIPIYIALLKLAGVEDLTNKPNPQNLLILVSIPCLLFLIATVFFMFGYFPSVGSFTLDIIEEIEQTRQQIIKKRKRLIIVASTSFFAGMCGSIAVFAFILF